MFSNFLVIRLFGHTSDVKGLTMPKQTEAQPLAASLRFTLNRPSLSICPRRSSMHQWTPSRCQLGLLKTETFSFGLFAKRAILSLLLLPWARPVFATAANSFFINHSSGCRRPRVRQESALPSSPTPLPMPLMSA